MSKRQTKTENVEPENYDSDYLLLKETITDDIDLSYVKDKNISKFCKGPSINDNLLEEAIYTFYGNKSVIIKNCGISRQHLYDRIAENSKLKKAFEDAKKLELEQVESSLMMRIKGYNAIETKAFIHNGEIIKVNVIKHYPPDVGAINSFFARKNIVNEEVKTFEDFVREVNNKLDE